MKVLEEKSVKIVNNEMSNIEDAKKEEKSGVYPEDLFFNVEEEELIPPDLDWSALTAGSFDFGSVTPIPSSETVAGGPDSS